jgi:hypothetical protein
MIENVFRQKYAECLILRTAAEDGSKGEAVGLALVRLHSSPLPCRGQGFISMRVVLLHLFHLVRCAGTLCEYPPAILEAG